jgi:hypothetical protein
MLVGVGKLLHLEVSVFPLAPATDDIRPLHRQLSASVLRVQRHAEIVNSAIALEHPTHQGDYRGPDSSTPILLGRETGQPRYSAPSRYLGNGLQWYGWTCPEDRA